MSQTLAIARETLLERPGLTDAQLEQVMDHLLSRQVDAADIYFQYGRLESWVLEDGIIKEGSHSIEQGAGLRAISGEKTGFAYTDSLDISRLLEAAGAARAIARAGTHGAQGFANAAVPTPLYQPLNPLDTLTENEKLDLMRRADAAARSADPRVQQVIVSLVAAHDTVLVMDNTGHISGDVRPLVRMNVQVIVEQDGRREQGSSGGGRARGPGLLSPRGPRPRLRARGGPSGPGQPGRNRRTRRLAARRARTRLARGVVARGGRPRP
jgi:TldD protein